MKKDIFIFITSIGLLGALSYINRETNMALILLGISIFIILWSLYEKLKRLDKISKVKEHKELKGLKSHNLRDHMSPLELALTRLGETTTAELARNTDAQGFDDNKKNDLKEELLHIFRGHKLTMQEIYERHNVDTPYIKKNYKEILSELYNDGYIKAISPKGKAPRKGTFGNNIIVTFPNQEGKWQ